MKTIIRIAGFNGSSFSLFDGCDTADLEYIDQDATQVKYENLVSEALTEISSGDIVVYYDYLTADQSIIAETGRYDAVTKWMQGTDVLPGGITLEAIGMAEDAVWSAGRFWIEK